MSPGVVRDGEEAAVQMMFLTSGEAAHGNELRIVERTDDLDQQLAERGDVVRRARTVRRCARVDEHGVSERAQHRSTAVVEQDVGRIDRAVDDAVAMEIGNGRGEGTDHARTLGGRERAGVGERAGAHPRRDELETVRPIGKCEQTDDAGVAGRGEHGRLPNQLHVAVRVDADLHGRQASAVMAHPHSSAHHRPNLASTGTAPPEITRGESHEKHRKTRKQLRC